MIRLLLAVVAAYGVHLCFSAFAFGWSGVQPGPRVDRAPRQRAARMIERSGLGDLDPRALLGAVAALTLAGFAFGIILFGGLLPATLIAAFAATVPIGVARVRHDRRIAEAHYAWPSLIEEIRLLTGTLGRSIPQATFEVGARAPEGLRPAFELAEREWHMSTDFARSLGVLKSALAHNTADVVAETLLTAHELGGGEVGNRLAALAQDRMIDQQHRRDAIARQAGVRFARWFTLVVPIGMAMVGLTIGDGRAAYTTSSGQIFVVVALVLTLACWLWAGRIMRLPVEERVFS